MTNLTKFNLNEISEKITKPWSPENIETVNNYVIRGKTRSQRHRHSLDTKQKEHIIA